MSGGCPDLGVHVADRASAGHDLVALDHRGSGEPTVVHVDQERDDRVTLLAPDLGSFREALVPMAAFS